MSKDMTGYEPIHLSPNISGFRKMLDQIRWYVVGLTLVFGTTISLVKITPQFFIFSNLIGFLLVILLIVAMRRRNFLYLSLAYVIVLPAMNRVTRFAWCPGEIESLSAFGIGFLLPVLLLWAGRRWVIQFCRLDEAAIESRD